LYKVAINILCIVLILPILFLFCSGNDNSLYGFTNIEDTLNEMNKVSVLAASTVIGIFCGNAYNYMGDDGSEGALCLTSVKYFILSKNLWRSLLAAPLLFSAVYSTVNNNPDIILSAVFAFENGFFCNLILSKKK